MNLAAKTVVAMLRNVYSRLLKRMYLYVFGTAQTSYKFHVPFISASIYKSAAVMDSQLHDLQLDQSERIRTRKRISSFSRQNSSTAIAGAKNYAPLAAISVIFPL